MVDRSYWNEFYRKGEAPTEGSTFAQSVLPHLKPDEWLFELGCGNGRDALYFAQNGVPVIGCDISEASIEQLQRRTSQISKVSHLHFVCNDFTRLETPFGTIKEKTTTNSATTLPSSPFGMVYSRFTLHAVRKEDASRAIQWSYDNLKDGGLLFIEVRSVLDPMCGKGTKVDGEEDAWINTHYRRFIRSTQLVSELKEIGFVIDYMIEKNGLAIYKDDDPVLIRVHARKPFSS